MQYKANNLLKKIISKKQTFDNYDIYFFDIYDFIDDVSVLFKALNAEEKEKTCIYKDEKKKNTFLIRKGLLRCILGNYLSKSPEEINICRDDYGKPYLEKNVIYFNLSHSLDMFVIAVSTQNSVGIDIQYIKKVRSMSLIQEEIYSTEEIEALEGVKDINARKISFFDIWTRKEAFSKCIGTGLTENLKEITSTSEIIKYKGKKISMISQVLSPEYVYAIAYEVGNRKEKLI